MSHVKVLSEGSTRRVDGQATGRDERRVASGDPLAGAGHRAGVIVTTINIFTHSPSEQGSVTYAAGAVPQAQASRPPRQDARAPVFNRPTG